MRKQIDGFCAIIEEQLNMHPTENSLFLFCGRKKESEIEVLSCDETDRIYNKIQKIVKIENFMSLTDQGD